MRTPKGKARLSASGSRTTVPRSAYRTPLHWTFFAEILVIAYCLAGAAWLIQQGEGLWSLAMILWGACLGLMVQQQIVHRPA